MKHLAEDLIEKYSLGRLDNAAASRVEVHLFVCDECRTRLDKFEFFLSVLRAGSGESVRIPLAMAPQALTASASSR
jgi:anti-sigma factor RsiW